MKKTSIVIVVLLTLLSVAAWSFLNRDTIPRGEVVLDNNIIYGATGPIVLDYNPAATDPTWDQLVSFLNEDTTDQEPYITGVRVCADFAEQVYDNAELLGIRAGYVVLTGANHAIDAFDTTDKGLVYVDCTGEDPDNVAPDVSGETTYGAPTSWDKIAYVQVGSPVGIISLSTALNYGLDYSAYTQWLSDKATFDQAYTDFNTELAGRTIVPQAEYVKLQAEEQEEQDLSDKLGAFWQSMAADGDVTQISVFWKGHDE